LKKQQGKTLAVEFPLVIFAMKCGLVVLYASATFFAFFDMFFLPFV